MTNKQLEEKKKQFVLDTVSLLERELTENDLDIIFGWIEKLVEEVKDGLAKDVEKELTSIFKETKLDGGRPYYKGYIYVTFYNLLLNRMRECVYQKYSN